MEKNNVKIKFGKLSTSEKEIKDILKAWTAISLAFAILLSGSVFSEKFFSSIYPSFIIASITVGLGFLLHELGHKIVAQRYGCFAEFRSFDHMLMLAVAMSFFGFLFAAPGAVMISGRVTKERNGKISAAGPIVNLILAAIFLSASMASFGIIKKISSYGFMINTWLALFNMIPALNFDGAKIFKWSKIVYGIIALIGIVFLLMPKKF